MFIDPIRYLQKVPQSVYFSYHSPHQIQVNLSCTNLSVEKLWNYSHIHLNLIGYLQQNTIYTEWVGTKMCH